ncbi:MAG: GAF domain-containing protein [Candidatus Limnocylindria bacterium]
MGDRPRSPDANGGAPSRPARPEQSLDDRLIESERRFSEQAVLEEALRRQSLELARQMESQRRLLAINEKLLSMRDSREVLETIAASLKQVVSYDNLGIYRVDREAQVLRPVLARDRNATEVLAYPVPFGKGLMNWAVSHQEPLLINDALSDPRAIQIPDTPLEPEAIVIVPLVVEGEVLGALNIGRVGREEVAFSDTDFELVQLFASQAAIAVANARLYDELQESERRYRYLVDHSPDIVWSVDAEGRLTFLSDSLHERTGWQPADLLGRHFGILTDAEARPEADAAFRRMREQPGKEQRLRIELRLKGNRRAPVEITMIGSEVDGRFTGAHGAVRDVTERERLELSLREQAGELAASAERANLARELHDSVTQALFSIGLTLRSLDLLLETDVDAARTKLIELRELQRDALSEMRSLIFELRPTDLEQEGLTAALRSHASAVQGRTGLSVSVDAELPSRPGLEIEEALYRIAQEALHNVVKHANAGEVQIGLSANGGTVCLTVADDGIGFDPDSVARGHIGLIGMRQRADQIGAELRISSTVGAGTRVEVSAPAGD